ncbi:hypothetical protein CMO93_00525 [Candidatus Woesearchaeota archaeon]|mgnify:CR=1 FL=1|nr:hypothetical protein [Candidatus Woesearchaeota archaeon]|tara:strand:+ start:276 stop:1349 length:1074 start_codon:yes stop_codon:yes gene_type:complete
MEEKYKGVIFELDYGKDIKIDVKDKKILAALAKNSRISPTHLSKIVGLSKDAIRYRIQKLKEKDVIRKNLLIVNPFIFFTPYTILLRLENINEEKEKKIIEFFINHPFIIWFGQCSGEWDFAINILSKDVKHFDMLMKEIKTKCLGNLKNYETMPIISLNKYETLPQSFYKELKIDVNSLKTYFAYGENFGNNKVGLGKQDINLDEQALKILKILSNDANAKIVDIAKKSRLSVDTVKHRIKKSTENKIILAFRTIINASYLHYHGYISFFQLLPHVDAEKRKMFESFFNFHEETAFVLETTGRYDFEVYIFAKDPLHFNTLLREIRNKFYDIIESHMTLMVLKDYKFDFLPKGLLD